MLKWLTGPSDLDRKAEKLYGAVVTAARRPAFYAELGVPDTPEGRFELVALHLFLVLDRVKDHGAAGRALAQRTIETFVTDMDDCMREMGVGDLTVPKRVKRAAAVFYERSSAYRAALMEAGEAPIAQVLKDAIVVAPGSAAIHAEALARYVRAADNDVSHVPFEQLQAAKITFPNVS
jgi:cytochrome b pre-mRNA-processing protein 3